MQYLFITIVPKRLNYATFRKIYYLSVNYDFGLYFGDDISVLILSFIFVYLLAHVLAFL